MDCVGPILDIGIRLWDCAAKRVRYIRNLEKNNTKLSNSMEELKSLRDDVKRRVEISESQDLQSTNQVSDWLKSVEALELEVDHILLKGSEEIRGECLVCRPRDSRSAYKLSKKTVKSLAAVEKLFEKGKFEAVAVKKPRNPADELPEERTVGLDSTMNEIWKCVQRNDVGIIGLFGMGGVGKTTLLKRINNTFFGSSSGDYDAVIWVVVSKEASTGKIQNAIRDRLQIPNDNWNGKNEDDRAMEIYKALSGKKFVLLVDDLWKRLDLLKLGVPLPSTRNGSKVIFTTRSEEICCQMEADRCVRVECLGKDEALELFISKMGKETLNSHPNILNLAKDVAEECKGLPLALITIGRSMASRKTIDEWERAVQLLKRYPASFTGVVDYVYHLLEFSYDSLPSDTVKSCFLYCSLFPKDYNIRRSELVELWIGEGFLDEFDDDIHDARRHGEEIIGTLKLACLLEPGESEESVKIHDVIRDMAIWLACEHGEKKNKFLVKEFVRPRYDFAKARDVSEKISLWGREIRDLSGVSFGPSVITLLVTGTLIKTLPSESFKSLLGLVVLDLSGNERLALLPEEIGRLKSLQSLNLSRTAIRALPTEMKNLKKLRSLLLNDTYDLMDVPSQVMSGLSSLRTFSRLLSPVCMQFYPDYDETALLNELERLQCIEDICITIIYSPSLQKILTGKKFQSCIRKLTVLCYLTPFEASTSCLSRTKHLESLETWNANPLGIFAGEQRYRNSSSFRALRILVVVQCKMSDMDWLAHVPCLGTLRIIDCPSIITVLTGDTEPTFPCLVALQLQGLPKLESIVSKSHRVGSAFPLLKKVKVMDCPRLTELPFGDSNESVKEISGAKEWWDKLVWNDETVKSFFAPKFVPLTDTTTSCESWYVCALSITH